MSDILDLLCENLRNTTWLEAVAVAFGLLSVWFARKANILVFPTGIVSVLLFVYICFVAKLYADMGINGFYFVMSVYGWYNWTHPAAGKKQLPVSYCIRNEHIISFLCALFFFFVIRYLLAEHTDSDVPNWDALTTAIFMVAMWLMAKKKVENWSWYIVGNAISIPLYIYKGLILTSFQYLVFLILAIFGLIEWIKIVKQQGQQG